VKRLLSHTTLIQLFLSLIFLQGCKNEPSKVVDIAPVASTLDSFVSKLSNDIESFTKLSLSVNALPESSHKDPLHTMLVQSVGGSLSRLNGLRDSIVSYKEQILLTKSKLDSGYILNEVALTNITAIQSKLNAAQEKVNTVDEVYNKLLGIYQELNKGAK
jgi:hypothetical protein